MITKGLDKKVYIETLGCQMNKSDTERIFGMLEYLGYGRTDEARAADLLIINTCSIRQLSADKAYSRLGVWGKWKRKKPELKLGMCGCVAQQDGEAILKRAPYVDIVFGTQNIYELPVLMKLVDSGETVVSVTEKPYEVSETSFAIHRQKGVNAWIPIMEGCNNFCTYCVVPYTRGRERSRQLDSVIKEAEIAIKEGFKEITLLGQNVDSYGKDFKGENVNLSTLLRALNAIEGKFRIRFVTSYPTDITDELVKTVKECEKVCEYFHIPMQSGNDEILKSMNRRYTREEYKKIIEKIRNTFENVTITSDFIAGFPGETEEQFEDTLSAIDEFELDYSNTAAYSPRENTVAARWTDKFISEEVKKERLFRLNEKNKSACLKSNKKFIGRTIEVLVESEKTAHGKTVLTARAENNKIVHFEGEKDFVGEFKDVLITGASTWCVKGKLLSSD